MPSASLPTIFLHLQSTRIRLCDISCKCIHIHCSCMVTNYEETETINQHPDILTFKKIWMKRRKEKEDKEKSGGEERDGGRRPARQDRPGGPCPPRSLRPAGPSFELARNLVLIPSAPALRSRALSRPFPSSYSIIMHAQSSSRVNARFPSHNGSSVLY